MSPDLKERPVLLRRHPSFERWAAGFGVIRHADATPSRVRDMAETLRRRGSLVRAEDAFEILAAADRVASAALWLAAHMVYARRVYLDGRELGADDFKTAPEGHSGGALNMVLAYTGYLAANGLSGHTRSWVMGQGHCVAAVDAVNVLVGNMTPAHADRYGLSDEGLTRLVQDFYSYQLTPEGEPASPLGSHVNAHTAGGMMEGGYLGCTEVCYAHMPLPGERLVAFLSDGAFEEQRGADWTPRWWRAEDSGLVLPVMIANGRRIDQRSAVAQQGGPAWLSEHLKLNGFDPYAVDGKDPASYAWGILLGEDLLEERGRQAVSGDARYPVSIPHAVADVPKGFGFPNAGTNRAHNLPLGDDPASDADARRLFNEAAAGLHVPEEELREAVLVLNNHAASGRPRERDHALARRRVPPPDLPEPAWRSPGEEASPMAGLDDTFCRTVRANPRLRARVGNPDEMRSNRLEGALELLKHRASAPEPGSTEDVLGGVITALNEEAVAGACLGNKGGINLIATYEAFGVKMLGLLRQELIFSRQLREAGRPPGWLSVPLALTSHAWENGKNERSHQDPTLCEALLGEMSDVSRVLFPADWNTAAAALRGTYGSRGEIWTLVTPKRDMPVLFTPSQAQELLSNGAIRLRGDGNARVLLAACGAYQLGQVLRASNRLGLRGVSHAVVYILEPGRFRRPRDRREAAVLAPPDVLRDLFQQPAAFLRVFLTHTRPEVFRGTVDGLLLGKSQVLGFCNRGGTLDVPGMLFANRCTWAHAVAAVEELSGEKLLDPEEAAAVEGRSPDPLRALGMTGEA